MNDLEVIDEPTRAGALLDPLRSRMLAHLAHPASAAALATELGVPRQKANYHLRELERHGLVTFVEERRKRGMTERVMQATALSYVISPTAVAEVQPDPDQHPDRLSGRWLIALASRIVKEVGSMLGDASSSGKRLATFALDGEIRFATAADRSAFAEELTSAVTALVGKYHDETAPRGRTHRILVAIHPGSSQPAGDRANSDEQD
jgi:DNA-binding transcriptional ArsR family regulator